MLYTPLVNQILAYFDLFFDATLSGYECVLTAAERLEIPAEMWQGFQTIQKQLAEMQKEKENVRRARQKKPVGTGGTITSKTF